VAGLLWIYFQPSEPLKLLLIIYLSAYLADKQPWTTISSSRFGDNESGGDEVDRNQSKSLSTTLPLLVPILIMTGLILLLLLVQRDLGTATIFLFLFAVIVYLATGRRLILILSVALLLLAGISSYFMFDVVQLRIDAWLNPWLDPSGRSYQIVQSLLAIAHGGVGGRGPGMGSPTLVPISHSDFIFTAIVEESGLVGGQRITDCSTGSG
jgi:cell division protein FtsW (lipid II flippase)